ncbi:MULTISPECIES: hypothetical protein [Halocynthiibacter]|uniref:Uncharacterized protein n=1 Tax=Halocynthiibacter halioticoli TaxID=2986804 RepID=A0AAE3IZI3_9RHOB|nr:MULTISPECIES: hypothetical protein [Halocynthiibacter]MCV6823778.1 hypothetical protein [Halocynthiibacter halioticoli]MCW4056779.1 hypothetical protein [Halocynthiibacter sp. SDUM655004]
MSRHEWHIRRENGVLTLSRDGNERFDIAAETELPMMARGRLAQQIRQDIWRALQGLRGFRPVVRIREEGGALMVTAGGRLDDARVATPVHIERLNAVLNDPANRSRWQRFARRTAHG